MTFLDMIDYYYSPKSNPAISENDDAYTIKLLAPGMKAEDFVVSVKEDKLEIKSDGTPEFRDMKFGTKTFVLPKNVDRQSISATYESGILILQIPKTEESRRVVTVIVNEKKEVEK